MTSATSTEEALAVRVAALEVENAETRAWRARVEPLLSQMHGRRSPSPKDRATLALIVARAPNNTPFQCGDLTANATTAKSYGEALARLLPHSPVDNFEIERLGQSGHRLWTVRFAPTHPGGPEDLGPVEGSKI